MVSCKVIEVERDGLAGRELFPNDGLDAFGFSGRATNGLARQVRERSI
jgi:hypothetical protein